MAYTGLDPHGPHGCKTRRRLFSIVNLSASFAAELERPGLFSTSKIDCLSSSHSALHTSLSSESGDFRFAAGKVIKFWTSISNFHSLNYDLIKRYSLLTFP